MNLGEEAVSLYFVPDLIISDPKRLRFLAAHICDLTVDS